MMPFTPEDVQGIADLIDQRVLAGKETIREEFYGAIQQLINNQTALAEMVAMRQGQGEVATMLAHEFWQRSIMAEAQRVQVQLDAAWEDVKPSEETIQREDTIQPDLPFDLPPRPKQCPSCLSRDADAIYRLANNEFCRDAWHGF